MVTTLELETHNKLNRLNIYFEEEKCRGKSSGRNSLNHLLVREHNHKLCQLQPAEVFEKGLRNKRFLLLSEHESLKKKINATNNSNDCYDVNVDVDVDVDVDDVDVDDVEDHDDIHFAQMANRKSRKFFIKRPFFPTLLPSSSSSPLYSSSSSFHDVSTINIKGCKMANDMNTQFMKRSSFNKENIYNVENTEIVSEKDQQITTCRKNKIYKHSYHHSYNDIFDKGCGNNQFHLPKSYSQPSQYLYSGSSTRTGQRSDSLLNSEIFSSERSSSLVTPCSNVEREQKKRGMGRGRGRKRKNGGRMGDSLNTTTTTLLKRQRGEQHDLMFAFPAKITDDSSSRPKPLKRFKSKSSCDLVFPNLNFKI